MEVILNIDGLKRIVCSYLDYYKKRELQLVFNFPVDKGYPVMCSSYIDSIINRNYDECLTGKKIMSDAEMILRFGGGFIFSIIGICGVNSLRNLPVKGEEREIYYQCPFCRELISIYLRPMHDIALHGVMSNHIRTYAVGDRIKTHYICRCQFPVNAEYSVRRYRDYILRFIFS